jgi:hypothetical protein
LILSSWRCFKTTMPGGRVWEFEWHACSDEDFRSHTTVAHRTCVTPPVYNMSYSKVPSVITSRWKSNRDPPRILAPCTAYLRVSGVRPKLQGSGLLVLVSQCSRDAQAFHSIASLTSSRVQSIFHAPASTSLFAPPSGPYIKCVSVHYRSVPVHAGPTSGVFHFFHFAVV